MVMTNMRRQQRHHPCSALSSLRWLFGLLLAVSIVTLGCCGFTPLSPLIGRSTSIGQKRTRTNAFHSQQIAPSKQQQQLLQRQQRTGSSHLFGGGFGGGGSGGGGPSDKKTKGGGSGGSDSTTTKLKPKQQWDRYLDLKRETKIRVAVRCKKQLKGDDSNDGEEEDEAEEEWLEVGRVKSKENKYTELAVVRQRALIAEHARRLYPLQISSKKTIEWGYYSDDDESWKSVDKSMMDEETISKVSKDEGVGLEKVIGFEGRPDPASGFYCIYDEGRLKKD